MAFTQGNLNLDFCAELAMIWKRLRHAMQTATLYAVPHSLYSGRARSYLIKAGIPYRERAPNSEHFHKLVRPRAGGRNSLPTLELANGDVIRDGAAIIDHFENGSGHPFSPDTPRQRFISRLFDVIGAEGLLRPAMHYRWNFDEENLDFLKFHFNMLVPADERRDSMAEKIMGSMRKATAAMGVSAGNRQVIEALYRDQLEALDRHFSAHGYLLGGRPCIGDFGMIAPLFAHLGRDPKPVSLMHAHAMQLYRWVERMNRSAADLLEFENQSESWLPDDEIPPTLVEVMAAMAEDFVPETLAAAEFINTWIAGQETLEPGTPCERSVGFARFDLRGNTISAMAQPYRFYLLKRAQDEYAAMGAQDRAALDAILDACQMTPLLGARLSREIGREDNLEVWL